MKTGFLGLLGIFVLALAFVGYQSMYIVTPTHQALVLQFGEVKGTVRTPGLQFKYPFVQNVIFLDKRILDLNMPPVEALASGKKRLVVDAFARYRIANPVAFYQNLNNVNEANQRLSTFLQSSLRTELAKATFSQIVRDDRSDLMEKIRKDVSASAAQLGIEVVDVKIRRADLPEENSQVVYSRMQSERQREATEIRAKGEEEGRRIRSRAEREATIIKANAQRDAEILRGDGDAERSGIFAEAYNKDRDFFSFFRSMRAYEVGLKDGDTSLVLSPNAQFFKFFNSASGTDAKNRAPVADGLSE